MKIIVRLLCVLAVLQAPAAFAQEEQVELDQDAFAQWLVEFQKDARKQGISRETLDIAFANTQAIARVIELDRKQPEGTLTLAEYLAKSVTDSRIETGKEMMRTYAGILEKVSEEYGVQPEFIVALWGIETNFGGYTGNFRTVDALATLAFDGRRSEYFRKELINALKILDQEEMTADDMFGSWAGALGQSQFMPSTFLSYAADFDGDGHHDIWNNEADVFASIANYLSAIGWNGNESWGMKVQVPDHFSNTRDDIGSEKTLNYWALLGVRKADGESLPTSEIKASLIQVGKGEDAESYLVYNNYKALLKWNRSRYFATAVGMLGDSLAP